MELPNSGAEFEKKWGTSTVLGHMCLSYMDARVTIEVYLFMAILISE